MKTALQTIALIVMALVFCFADNAYPEQKQRPEFLYKDSTGNHYMNPDTFEEIQQPKP